MQARTEMQLIEMITDNNPLLKNFIVEINRDIAELNILIQSYNEEEERSKKIAKLQTVYRRKQEIESKFSDGQLFAGGSIQSSAQYAKVIQEKLFVSLQEQFRALGIPSMLDVATLDPTAKEFKPGPAHNMEEILANMTPEYTKELLTALSAKKGTTSYNFRNFENLFKHSLANPEYQDFLKNHTISELNGDNSRNYLITPKDDAPIVELRGSALQVLKVDFRPATPRTVEDYLRANSLKYVLTGNIAQRSVHGEVQGEDKTRTLLITEYCPGGSLDKHATKRTDDGTRLLSALNFFGQMARILFNIQNDGCAFPDMKTSNWLVDADNMLRMHDGKSLIRTYDGNVDQIRTFAERYLVLTTDHVRPPELAKDQFSADKAHAYMLGKNLYEYLTGLNLNPYKNKHDAADFDFSGDIFKGNNGIALKALILGLVKPNPDHRTSIKDALAELNRIQDLVPHTKCLRLINELQSQYPDAQLFCQSMRENLSEAFSDSAVQDLIDSILDRTRCEEVRKKVQDLREGALKGHPSMEEFYKRTRDELSHNSLTLERHAELLQEIEKLQGILPKLQQRDVALRKELETRYPQFNWKTRDRKEETSFKGLRKNVNHLTQQLRSYLDEDCRTFLQELSSYDLDYAQSIDTKLTSVKSSPIGEFIKLRDELALKHKELHTNLSNECNKLNLEVNSGSEFTVFDTKIQSSSISFLETIKLELTALKKKKEFERSARPLILSKSKPESLPVEPTRFAKMPEPALEKKTVKTGVQPGFTFKPVDPVPAVSSLPSKPVLEPAPKPVLTQEVVFEQVEKNNIINQCQNRINQLKIKSIPAANLMQIELNNAKTIADCEKVANLINSTFEQIVASDAHEEDCQRVLQECQELLQQNIALDPNKENYYTKVSRFLKSRQPSLESLEAQKRDLISQLTHAQEIKRVQEVEQRQLLNLREEFQPFLRAIQERLPGGEEGQSYCETVNRQLKTSTIVETQNILRQVKSYCDVNSKSKTEHIADCKALINNIRAHDQRKPSRLNDSLLVELNTKNLPLYELRFIKKNLSTQLQCAELIASIRRVTPKKDIFLLNHLNQELNKLNSSLSDKALNDMKTSLTRLKNDPATRIIKEIIADYRQVTCCSFTFYNTSMSEKADSIEKALFNVPVLQRTNLWKGTSGTVSLVRDELAKHRSFFKNGEVYKDNNGIIEKDAADAYKTFCKKMRKEEENASKKSSTKAANFFNKGDQSSKDDKPARLATAATRR